VKDKIVSHNQKEFEQTKIPVLPNKLALFEKARYITL